MSAASALYILSQVVTPGGTIHQITDHDFDAGVSEAMVGGSGSIDYEFGASMQIKPMISFSTTALKTALGIAGINGYSFVGTGTFHYRKVNATARDDTACVKLTIGSALFVPKGIKASNDPKQPASISYDVYVLSTDGSTAPITIATAQTLPAYNIAAEAFTVGPIKLNSSFLNAIDSVDIDFGLKVESIVSDGFAWPTFCAVIGPREQTIKFTSWDTPAINTLTLEGLAITASIVYLRQVKTGSTRWADGNSKHIKLTGTTGYLKPERLSGRMDSAISAAWMLRPLYDGSNAILTAAVDQAIA